MIAALLFSTVIAQKPKALIWRDNGPVGCSGCSEPFQNILEATYDIYFVGPNDLELTAEEL